MASPNVAMRIFESCLSMDQVALRDQGFAIGSMFVQIEGAVDGPTQAEEGCCGGDDEQKCTGVARVLLLYDEAFKHDYASGHKRRMLAGV